MTKRPSVDDLIKECHLDSTSEERLLTFLGDQQMLVRVNALLALAKRRPSDEERLVREILKAASAATRSDILIGTMTEPMFAALTLERIGTTAAREASNVLRATMTREQKEDLAW